MRIYQEDIIAAHEERKREDQEARWDNRRRTNRTTQTCWRGLDCPICNPTNPENVWPPITR